MTQAPVILKNLENIEVDENQPAEFAVQLQRSDKEPQVEWSHNGVVIKDSPLQKVYIFQIMINLEISKYCFSSIYLKMTNMNNGVYVLKIKQVKTKDAGAYTCRVYNSAGSIKSDANLVVKSMLKGSSESKPISSVLNKFFMR